MIFKTKERRTKFFSYYKPYLKPFILDLIFASIATIITLIIPLLIRYITGELLVNALKGTLNQLYYVGAIMILLLIVKTLFIYYTDSKGHAIGAMMESDMREELFEHYQKQSYSFYDNHNTGELTSRVFNDTVELGEFFHHAPEDVILYIVRFVGALGILFTINVKLTFVAILFLPIMALFAIIGSKKLSKIMNKTRAIISKTNAQVEESISGMRVIQSYTNEDIEFKKFQKANKSFLKSRVTWYNNEAVVYGGVGFFVELIPICLVVIGAMLILNVQLELSDLLVFMLYVGFLTEPLTRIMWMFSQYQGAFTSFHRFMDILEIKPIIIEKEDAIDARKLHGVIHFDDVNFGYNPEDTENLVINNLNLSIAAGEYVALVGPSGVGKTTMCTLLPRFYDIQSGIISIDGVDIRDFTLQSLRKNIGVVSQDIYLFSGTIFENIAFGKQGATLEEVIHASKKAGADEFISKLPQGYDTEIGQRGIKLSGGQRQRLSVAQAFLKDAPIIIFDEATSSLDYESERIVQKSLEDLSKNRTTIVIAHRLSTIENAERILVLSESGIVEEGTHDELIIKNGMYKKLYQTRETI